MREMLTLVSVVGVVVAQIAETAVEKAAEYPGVPGIITGGGALGLLAFYMFHDITKRQPARDAAAAAKDALHAETIADTIKAFREEMRLERESHRGEVDGLRESIEKTP